MRLIDADALKATLGMKDDCSECGDAWKACHYDRIYPKLDFCEWIDDAPTVDAVPVVRCRDCKYSYIFEPWEGKNAVRYCNQLRHAYAKDSDLPVREEGFCSMGERREEDAVD